MMKRKVIWSVLLAIGILIMFSCKKEKQAETDNETIIPSTTKLIPAATFNDYLLKISPDTSEFTFSAGSSLIESIVNTG